MLAKGSLEFNLNIKLHPGYDLDNSLYLHSFMVFPNVQVISSDSGPSTYDLLINSDVHLSISSACHFDSLGLGIPTIILGIHNFQTVIDLYNKEYALVAKSPAELYDIISSSLYKKIKINENIFFEKHSLSNISKIINLNV